jgi:phosphonoacetaldehyde hydrolase
VGIEAGRNAGAITVAIARTGNALGLSVADLQALPAEELERRLRLIREDFDAAGAHHVLDSVADLRSLVS